MLEEGAISTTVVVVASGPSFDEEQAAEVVEARGRGLAHVIVVNDNYRRVPNADVLYACDGRWWRHHWPEVVASGFAGCCWTQDEGSARTFGLCRVRVLNDKGLSRKPATVHSGGNGGYQAIGLAYNFGARRIVLVGFDMQATGGAKHWFGAHPTEELDRKLPFADWVRRFPALAKDLADEGVDVVNASRETALSCFRRAPLSVALR